MKMAFDKIRDGLEEAIEAAQTRGDSADLAANLVPLGVEFEAIWDANVDKLYEPSTPAPAAACNCTDTCKGECCPAPTSDDLVERLKKARGDDGGTAIYEDQDAIDTAIARIRSGAATIEGLRAEVEELAVIVFQTETRARIAEAALAEKGARVRFYQEREEHFAKVFGVCDGGRYREDWGGYADRMVRRAEAAEAALRAIIARADNNEPGTSKVQDMKRIAVEALKP